MTEYISVPVPRELVPAVFRLIADSHQGAAESQEAGGVGDNSEDSRDWSRAELQMLAEADAPSVKSFCAVLDLLAGVSPQPMSIKSIGDALGEPGLTLQNRFGAVSRWMRNRMDGDMRWPIHFAGQDWYMNEHNAGLWRQTSAR